MVKAKPFLISAGQKTSLFIASDGVFRHSRIGLSVRVGLQQQTTWNMREFTDNEALGLWGEAPQFLKSNHFLVLKNYCPNHAI